MSFDDLTFRISGMDEVKKMLADIPTKLATKAVEKAWIRALTPMMDAAIQNCPRKSGFTQSNIAIKANKLMAELGSYGQLGYILEEGHRMYGHVKSGGEGRGHKRGAQSTTHPVVAGRGYMRKAFDEKGEEAISLFNYAIAEEVEKAAGGVQA